MEEIRKNQAVQIELKSGEKLEGLVFDYSHDRVQILISFDSLNFAKNLKELDVVLVHVNTHIGYKKMFSHVIDELKPNNCITVENNDVIPTIQRREHVRVVSDLIFRIENKEEKFIRCNCLNISGGGIAFSAQSGDIELNESVLVILPEYEFDKQIICEAKIIKANHDFFVAKFENLTPAAEGRIIKYVFKLIAKK